MSKQSYGGRNNCRHHHPKWQLPFLPWNWTELSFLPAVSTQGPGTGWIMEPKKTSAVEMALPDTHKGEKGRDSIFTAILALFSQGSWVFCVFPHIVLTLSFSHMNLSSDFSWLSCCVGGEMAFSFVFLSFLFPVVCSVCRKLKQLPGVAHLGEYRLIQYIQKHWSEKNVPVPHPLLDLRLFGERHPNTLVSLAYPANNSWINYLL